MNKENKEFLDMLGASFRESSENIEIPDALSAENIVSMLKENKDKENNIVSISEAKNNKKTIKQLRRFIAVAACFIIIIGISLLAKYPSVIKTAEKQSAFSGFDFENPIRKLVGFNDVDETVNKIVSNEPIAETTAANDEGLESRLERIRSSLYEKYGKKSNVTETAGFETISSPASDENIAPGIQKADIVKSNDENLFVLTCIHDSTKNTNIEEIRIINALPPEEMKVVSTIAISSSDKNTVRECIELYLSGNTLIAMVKEYDASSADNINTVALCYDVSNPASPKLLREHIQQGSCVYTTLSGNMLYIATSTAVTQSEHSVPTFTVDGKKFEVENENVLVSVNAPESKYLLLTATDISSFSQPGALAILGCGNEIVARKHSVYITRSFASSETGEKKTELYRIISESGKLNLSAFTVIDGNILGGTLILDSGKVGIITQKEQNLSAYILDSSLSVLSSLENFSSVTPSEIKFVGNFGFILTDNDTQVINFNSSEGISNSGNLSGISKNGTLISVSDSDILSIEKNSDGIKLSLLNLSEKAQVSDVYNIEGTDISSPAIGNRRAIITNGNYVAVPVITCGSDGNEESTYMLFNISEKITFVDTFVHEENYVSDAASRGTIIGNNLYTVSGEKVVSYLLNDNHVISSLEVN